MGFNSTFLILLLLFMITLFAFIPMTIACIVTLIIAILKRKSFQKSIIILLTAIILFVFIPFSFYIGAITSLKIAGKQNVLNEAMSLIESHKEYFEKEKKKNNPWSPQKEIAKEELPPAIRKLGPVWVRVYEEDVVLKKIGLGDVTGFLIAPGRNLSGIRKISDGIYWITPAVYNEE